MQDARQALDQAHEAFAAGHVEQAAGVAAQVLAERPHSAEAQRILGLCHRHSGRTAEAVASLRAAVRLDRTDPTAALDLAALLTETGRAPAAETVLRQALSANRRSVPLLVALANLLTASARAQEALRLLAGLTAPAATDHAVLAAQATALKAAGRPDAALATQRRAATLYPDSPAAHHNLAAGSGDLGQYAAAETHAARAMALGGDAPQTWLVYARGLLGQGKHDAAERAFRGAIDRAPTYLDPHRDLAQLVWMRTEDPAAATAVLDAAIRAHPRAHPLAALRATVLHHAGLPDAAYATLQAAALRHPDEPTLQLAASQQAALVGRHQDSLRHAENAAALLPHDQTAQTVLPHDLAARGVLCAACLAAGQAERAGAIAAAMLQRHPHDQRALAYQATAWRLTGDPRYAQLYDYASFVRAWTMDVPDGWADLPAYLADLTQALGGLHPFRTHPLDQSLRHGSQATHLLSSDDPAIRAFFQAVDGPIRRHMAALGAGSDPLRARRTGGYRLAGAWSVRLRPGGFHTDHIHPEGWLSSACYIALPSTPADGREAWIKFGEPGVPTAPALAAEHFVQPEAGMVVLFPSYMWHGTVPFAAGGARLSVAFDVVPTA